VYLFTGGVGFFTYKFIRLSADSAGNASASAYARENTAVSNAVQGIREILIYQQQPVFLDTVSDAAKSGNNPRAYLNISSTIPSWLMEVCGFIIISAAIAMLTRFWHMDMAQITKIVILLMLTSWRALPSLNKVVNLVVVIRGVRPLSLPCLEMIKTLRANAMELPSPPDPNFSFDRDIRLENVFFRYPVSSSDCLMNISLTIPKGELIGFIGSSGGGKSTMITILSGLLEPTSGVIQIDGKRLSPAGRSAYCLRVGYVPQNPFFMAGSLAENIAFSEWGKPCDEERVRSACKRAAIDFITPERGGLQMPLGDKASNISGGQAQRVAIARALYVNPDIVIFDEATSSLDQANEKIIHETVMSLRKSTTCIIVSHRLTTIEACSYLFWIEQGRIIAEGTPSEILPCYVETMKNKGEPLTDVGLVKHE
jgi:ABC-type multidrug transport system fused ATPase/permease subunit